MSQNDNVSTRAVLPVLCFFALHYTPGEFTYCSMFCEKDTIQDDATKKANDAVVYEYRYMSGQ
jgi:hypothetical protein